MTIVLALEHLYTSVSASFVADGILADNVFGWRQPAQHPRRPRIAWVPGDVGGAVGVTVAPRNPGGNPRSLGTLNETFSVYITATDTSSPEVELAQYHIVRMLRDAWYRAVYHVAYGTFTILGEAWATEHNERRSGATLIIVCQLEAAILDVLPDPPLVASPNDISAADARPLDAAVIDAVIVPDDFEPTDTETITPVAFSGEDVDGTMGAHTQSIFNKNMAALATAADGDLACATALAKVPALDSAIAVSVNGLREDSIGNGTKVAVAAYFSGDGGVTARAWNLLEVGDLLYWNGSVAGYELAVTDVLSFVFEERGGS